MVIEIKCTSEVVIWRGLLKQIKTSKLYVNGYIVTSSVYKRETVIVYW